MRKKHPGTAKPLLQQNELTAAKSSTKQEIVDLCHLFFLALYLKTEGQNQLPILVSFFFPSA
jgi:hypothetical protein